MQDGVVIQDKNITGTLKYIEGGIAQSGPLAGSGNFLALKFDADWSKYTSVKIGLQPSKGTGLVEVINDPDKNGVFKIDSNNQKLKVVMENSTGSITETYNLVLNLEKE